MRLNTDFYGLRMLDTYTPEVGMFSSTIVGGIGLGGDRHHALKDSLNKLPVPPVAYRQ